jgi:hypothetical protein
LQPAKDAVVRLGAVLIVKIDWVVSVNQLSSQGSAGDDTALQQREVL